MNLLNNDLFWARLEALIARYPVVIDRPKGSAHPRYPDYLYPLDYGYLDGVAGGDGEGLDVWIGSLGMGKVTGLLCTVDAEEHDMEIKLLIGCTPEEMQHITEDHNRGVQSGVLLTRTPH